MNGMFYGCESLHSLNLSGWDTSNSEMEGFFDYIGKEENIKKLHHLSIKEKELMYYFDCLPAKDKEEIIEIIKLKLRLAVP